MGCWSAGKMALLAVIVSVCAGVDTRAADVYGKRFDPPRVYFAHSSLNKSGTTSAIKGQVNFIDVYMTPIDNTEGKYAAEGFTYAMLLPAFVDIPDADEQELTIKDVEYGGRQYKSITRPIPAGMVDTRCLRGEWGSSHLWLWFRISADREVPDEPLQVELNLHFKGELCFTDKSRLKVYEPLVAPRLPAEYFKLWLHYGPRYRMGKWDELADYVSKAGLNAIQSLESLEFNVAMRKRGFYLIHQRSGSYHTVYENDFHDCITEGPDWFGKVKNAELTEERMRAADATLLDFEPGPAGRITGFRDYEWLLERFRKRNDLPADTELTEEIIRKKYFKEWVDMRQDLAAQVVRNWGDYCRSVNPKIDAIMTQGTPDNTTSNVDYARYADHVTYVDPMNFTRPRSLQHVKEWMARSPDAQFTGCQNISAGGYSNVFVSDRDMMLQVLGAALIGCKGTSFYAGWALDAANYVLFNRVMTFMARHREIMFEGTPDPANLILAPLPKQDTAIDLGGGKKIRNIYPDWNLYATTRAYHNSDLDEYLAVINNRNTKESCYVKLTAAVSGGRWYVVDQENEEVFRLKNKTEIRSADLADGVHVHCPPFDYRGYSLKRVSAESTALVKGYQPVDLEQVRTRALAYSESGEAAGEAVAEGGMRLGFDDYDRDNTFEYVVESPGQKVWVSQSGTILKWKVGDVELLTIDNGLCRDQLWLPQSERSNSDMAAVMRLKDKRVHGDGVDMVFSKGVTLASLGAMVGLQITKTFKFTEEPGNVTVTVRLFNDSLSMVVPSIDLSYRVHNYVNHEERGKTVFWSYDGLSMSRWDDWRTRVVMNEGLSEEESLRAFTRCEVAGPQSIDSFGEYLPHKGLLLTVHPADASKVLQALCWRPENTLDPIGTLEWMYRPHALAQGKDVSFEYRISVRTGVKELTPDTIARRPDTAGQAGADTDLLFHVDFERGPDAVVAEGAAGEAAVTGDVTYEEAPGGRGVRLPEGASLRYLSEGNIDPQRGRLHIKFKPLWHGGDGVTRYFVQVSPRPGHIYFGKLNDGRYIYNMFDIKGKQHWPWSPMKSLEPGGWHDAMVAWDTEEGTIQLYFDGKKTAETRGPPWNMGKLDNNVEKCRIAIGGSPIVIDEIKIWAR